MISKNKITDHINYYRHNLQERSKSPWFEYDDSRKIEFKIQQIEIIIDQILNHKMPESYPDFMLGSDDLVNFDRGSSELVFREIFINNIGFSLISMSWIKPLAKWIGDRKVLEIMSGCGSLSYALKEENIDIITTDNYSWKNSVWFKDNKNLWLDTENIDCKNAILKYGKDVDIILMSWAYMDNNAYKCLELMRKVNPNCVMIYIGEPDGGCTADDEFFESLTKIKDKEFDNINNIYPFWFGIHDKLWLIK